jgi:hypothetical protein
MDDTQFAFITESMIQEQENGLLMLSAAAFDLEMK